MAVSIQADESFAPRLAAPEEHRRFRRKSRTKGMRQCGTCTAATGGRKISDTAPGALAFTFRRHGTARLDRLDNASRLARVAAARESSVLHSRGRDGAINCRPFCSRRGCGGRDGDLPGWAAPGALPCRWPLNGTNSPGAEGYSTRHAYVVAAKRFVVRPCCHLICFRGPQRRCWCWPTPPRIRNLPPPIYWRRARARLGSGTGLARDHVGELLRSVGKKSRGNCRSCARANLFGTASRPWLAHRGEDDRRCGWRW